MIHPSLAEYKGYRLAYLSKSKLIDILQNITMEVNSHLSNKTEYSFKKELLANTKSINIIRFIITMLDVLQKLNMNMNYDNHVLLKEKVFWKSYKIKFKMENNKTNNEIKYMYDIPTFHANNKKLIEAIKIDIIQAYSENKIFLYNSYMKDLNHYLEKLAYNEKLEVLFELDGIEINILVYKLNLQKLNGIYKFNF